MAKLTGLAPEVGIPQAKQSRLFILTGNFGKSSMAIGWCRSIADLN